MKNDFFIHEVKFSGFLKMIAYKIKDGFIIAAWNEQLPFVVLVKERKPMNHFFHFILSCVTLGVWIPAWMFLGYMSMEKKILISIDEEGNPFEEKCYMKAADYKLF